MLRLFLIQQDKNPGYDTYDSAVVAAVSAKAAKKIHPSGKFKIPYTKEDGPYPISATCDWVNDPEDVTVTYLGVAGSLIEEGVVCASYNAG